MDLPPIPDYEDSDEEKVDLRTIKGARDVGTDLSGWADMYLKDEIKKTIREMGFETPSEVQRNAIPIILEGKDLLCQARSGMGKTAVFMIGVLNRLSIVNGQYIPFNCLIICHTRELAHQLNLNFRRFTKYFREPELRIDCFIGGQKLEYSRERIAVKDKPPHIIIGTPGRLSDLSRLHLLPLDKMDFFIIDECDKIFQSFDMRMIAERLFERMKKNPQVLMFSATLPEEAKKWALKFMQNEEHIFVDPGKLMLTGLSQFNVFVQESNKLKELTRILDMIKFDQGVVFVNQICRAKLLTTALRNRLFNPICLFSELDQQSRLINYDKFKSNHARILVATDLFGRGLDVERVNLVVNYDLPYDKETYLHRVGRAGRFNTRGIIVNLVCPREDITQKNCKVYDMDLMIDIEEGLAEIIPKMPEDFDYRKYI